MHISNTRKRFPLRRRVEVKYSQDYFNFMFVVVFVAATAANLLVSYRQGNFTNQSFVCCQNQNSLHGKQNSRRLAFIVQRRANANN